MKPQRCDVGVDLGDPALPVAGTGRLSSIRRSRNAPRRAIVLIAVQLLIAAHITHFIIAGRTLSPVEPSEAMYTLELGQINAGFIFFSVTILTTLLLGRFFCGWGCHIVALQDFCSWLMKKVGIRPRPFRSRLLLMLPAALAFYMFVWPTLRRWLGRSGEQFAGWSNHLMVESFWETFPGPVFAVLTLVTCGFGAVYALGAKGFCTYGCPYGAIFGFADRFAPGRIRVTDACDQCGHCTATCTSNVLVHEEVRRHGMVTDPGCMKCMDCVSVCPKDALYYGFGPTRPAKQRRLPAVSRRYPLTWSQELGLLTVALAATASFRGLYDGPPLLMSVGLGGITAYVALRLIQLFRSGTVRVQNLDLKLGGKLRPVGAAFAILAVLWLVFVSHSGYVQWHRHWGRHHLNATEATRDDVLAGSHVGRSYSEAHARAARSSLEHFSRADGAGLVGVPEVKLGLAWGHLLAGEYDRADARMIEAIELRSDRVQLHHERIELLLRRGEQDRAIDAYRLMLASVDGTAEDHFVLAGLLVEAGHNEEAVVEYGVCLELAPDSAKAHHNLGGLLRRMERVDQAIEQLERSRELNPDDPDTRIELGLALLAAGRRPEARVELEQAVALDPDSPESRLHLAPLIRELSQRP